MKPSSGAARKCYGAPLVFDPLQGQTIKEPPGEGRGYWVGAPSVLYDDETKKFYLYYRIRKPRPVRGGECHIAASDDGVTFHDIWNATKEDLDSPSVERFSLTKSLDGKWLLYPSYVDPQTNRWRIDVVEAESPDAFDLSQCQELFSAKEVGVQGVKDPWVMIVNGLYYMLISYAMSLDITSPEDREKMHATADIYNTGLTLSSTALAVSGDGRHYEWKGDIFPPRQGAWDAYAARLGCLIPTESGWLGYYDGAASVEENYEERTGMVQSWDLTHFYRLSQQGPSIVSPYGSGGLRYVDAIALDGELYLYYEFCRPDGSHELRLNRLRI
ncbi:MAG: hypothetical protein U9R48_04350 [Chloroflexota bacterium]|nr:hypothetical protein [Chloroflexota bacterium]